MTASVAVPLQATGPIRGAAVRALFALAIGAFGIGMTEFVVMGLLPDLAADLLTSHFAADPEAAIAQTGWLISFYALGVVIGAPTISGFAARYPRQRVLVVLAAAMALCSALTAIAPTFELVAVSRLLAGLPHGAYFGMAALVAADMLGPARRARGIAIVLTGLTVANVVGVPLGTYMGQLIGWRTAFVAVTLVFAFAAVAIIFFVPKSPGDPGRTFRAELGVFRIPQVWFTVGVGAIGFGGFFAVYSYVAPLVTEVAGQPAAAVPLILVLMGLGMTVGTLLGGVSADRNLARTIIGAMLVTSIAALVMLLVAQSIVALAVLIFIFATVASMISPAVQTRLMDVAGDNQSIAAALTHSALNVGNSLGALLGGIVIASGWGFRSPVAVALILSLAGAIVAAWSFRLDRRATPKLRE
ncbi:MAG TPA: MFS transporter [Microbacteriaceae bacterium]|nr:MFS transporter [Microbacteriaceae bacterium]HQZ47539.1 MFS transporter [Microbacteriaceae bacterium]HRA09878.1 MFS transporter [Microbacteriaceae bacterium]